MTIGNNALAVSGGIVNVTDSTFTGSGPANVSATEGAITASGGNLMMAGNNIAPPAASNFVFHVSGGNVTARYNSLSNAMTIRHVSGTADFSHNWWGTNAGPAASSLNGTVFYEPYLQAPVTAGRIAVNSANLTAGNSTGVDISSFNTISGAPMPAAVIAAARNTDNVQMSQPVGMPFAKYDVYVSQPSANSTLLIKFYDAHVTSYTIV